jgi:hypothetical protein
MELINNVSQQCTLNTTEKRSEDLIVIRICALISDLIGKCRF